MGIDGQGGSHLEIFETSISAVIVPLVACCLLDGLSVAVELVLPRSLLYAADLCVQKAPAVQFQGAIHASRAQKDRASAGFIS